MAWKLAMVLALLPVALPIAGRAVRLRAWVVMMAAALAAMSTYSMWLYVAIDVAAAAAIMWPPRNVWQRAIGLCFVTMILLTTGYVLYGLQIFSSAVADPGMLQAAHTWLGWLALSLLLVWTFDDAFGDALGRYWNRGDVWPAGLGRVR